MRRQVTLQAFADAGAQRVMLQDFLPRDLEHVALMGEFIARLTGARRYGVPGRTCRTRPRTRATLTCGGSPSRMIGSQRDGTQTRGCPAGPCRPAA